MIDEKKSFKVMINETKSLVTHNDDIKSFKTYNDETKLFNEINDETKLCKKEWNPSNNKVKYNDRQLQHPTNNVNKYNQIISKFNPHNPSASRTQPFSLHEASPEISSHLDKIDLPNVEYYRRNPL